MSLVLDDVGSGYNLSKINSNFQKLEDFANDGAISEDNNVMTTYLDMNSNRIVNVAEAENDNDAVSYSQVKYITEGLQSIDGNVQATEDNANAASESAAEAAESALQSVSDLKAAALAVGTTYDNITYSTNLVDEIKGYIFVADTQITYAVTEAAQGKFISSIVDGVLTTTDTSEYSLALAPRYSSLVYQHLDIPKISSAASMLVGVTIKTMEYNSGSDVGGNTYKVAGESSSIADGGSVIQLSGDYQLIAIFSEGPVNPYQFGVLNGVDSTDELQAFLDFMGSYNGASNFDWSANTMVNKQMVLDGTLGSEKEVKGALILTGNGIGLTTIDNPEIFIIKECSRWYFSGELSLNGYKGYNSYHSFYSGLQVINCRQGRIEKVSGRGMFGQLASVDDGNSNMFTINHVVASNCGLTPNMTPSNRSISYVESSGSGSSGNYKSKVSLDLSDIPTKLINRTFVIDEGGMLHVVMNYDSVLNQAELYPGWLSDPVYSSCYILFGGALYTSGGDSGEIRVSSIVATNCGVGFNDAALYGAIVDRLTTQACGVGYSTGTAPASVGGFGTVIGQIYCETNNFDVVSVSTAGRSSITTTIAINFLEKCIAFRPPFYNQRDSFTARISVGGPAGTTEGDESNYPIQPIINEPWSRVKVIKDPAQYLVDGLNASREDRVVELAHDNPQAVIGRWVKREFTIYNQVKNFNIEASDVAQTVNGVASLTIDATKIPDGAKFTAILDGSNWLVSVVPLDSANNFTI